MVRDPRKQIIRERGGVTMEIESHYIEAQFDDGAVKSWIEAGWLQSRDSKAVSEIDLARAQLIHELKSNLGVNDQGIPLILDLIDQLHGLRRAIRGLIDEKDTRFDTNNTSSDFP
jgi:chaperone modulatory protein CbpM